MGILDLVKRVAGGTQPNNIGSSGAVLAQLLALVESRPGGLAGLMQGFQQAGLGHLFDSWVSRGQNLPISPEQAKAALGPACTQQLARATGLPPGEVEMHLATLLPQTVDHLTPDGLLPKGDLTGALEAAAKRFLQR